MSTDTSSISDNKKPSKSSVDFAFVGGIPSSISNIASTLQSIDTNSPDADSNSHSIAGADGGRIELDEDEDQVLKK